MATHVLVTGAAGYLGSILCEHLLAAGHRVTAVDRLAHNQASLLHLCADPGFEFVRGDVRDERLMATLVPEADVLVPLAAVVGAPACDRDPWLARSGEPRRHPAARTACAARGSSSSTRRPTAATGRNRARPSARRRRRSSRSRSTARPRSRPNACSSDRPNVITLRLATVFGMSPRMRLDLLVNHFVYAAVTDGYLVIFEKDFKRNYVHIRDVADCFVHAIGHAEQMVGRPFNVGLDAANLSKAELALRVKAHVPGFYILFAEVGSDPDKRNYVVSNQRLRDAGFEARRSLDDGIRELVRGYRMLPRSAFANV